MSKNKKKLHWSETRKLKKIIRGFNREFNLEKLCLTPELVKNFEMVEKRLRWLFFVVIAIVFVLLMYFRHNEESFYFLSLFLVPIIVYLVYFYFIPKARKDKGYKDDNSFSYWATEEDYKKRLKKIAKKYSKKEKC